MISLSGAHAEMEAADGGPEVALECTPMAIIRRLGKKPYDWQDAVMRDIMEPGSQTALRAANESGKTSIICAAIVLWHLLVFVNSQVVITSGSWIQVKKQVFAALAARADAFPGWQFLENEIIAPNGNRCFGFSTDDPGKAEGWHAIDHTESPLLIIVDEAKSVPDSIFGAFERCRPTRLLLMSSPGQAAGAFYRAFTTEREGFKHHVVTAYQCPHIDPKTIAAQIAKYGSDHPLVRSMIFAEWMLGNETEQFVLPAAQFDIASASPTAERQGEISAFCDFAISPNGDECVLARRNGNVVEIIDAWRGSGDSIREAHRFVTLFRQHGLREEEIAGDVSGIGAAYISEIATMGFSIRKVNNGDDARDKSRYANLGTEMWFEACDLIRKGRVIIPFKDELLRKQLTERKFEPNLDGQVQLVSKKKQGGSSPDRADAVVGCLWGFNAGPLMVDMFKPNNGVLPTLDQRRQEFQTEEEREAEGASWMSSSV